MANSQSPSTDYNPSHEWKRLFDALLAMRPDGSFEDRDVEFDLIFAGLLESREVKKPCRNCGTPLLDYRYNHITPAGRLFMATAEIARAAQ